MGGHRVMAARTQDCGSIHDHAGEHMPDRLFVPANTTIVPLPTKCSGPNSQQNLWKALRVNGIRPRVFTCQDTAVDHCADA